MSNQDQRQHPSRDDETAQQTLPQSAEGADSGSEPLDRPQAMILALTNETAIRGREGTESDRTIAIDFVQGQLKYGGNEIDAIDSQWDSTGNLVVSIDNGDSWDAAIIYGPSTLSNTTTSGKRTLSAPFPSSGETTWILSDEDEPPVNLKIVVRKI